MKQYYISPRCEALALDGQDFVCASDVPGSVILPVDGSAKDNGITDGDSRFMDFIPEF